MADARAGLAQIMCTIHQPSSDICENFDNLILLSCGRLLYCGAWAAADAYFAAAGFECAPSPCQRPCSVAAGHSALVQSPAHVVGPHAQ